MESSLGPRPARGRLLKFLRVPPHPSSMQILFISLFGEFDKFFIIASAFCTGKTFFLLHLESFDCPGCLTQYNENLIRTSYVIKRLLRNGPFLFPGNYSVAGFELTLRRKVSHYIITYYLPSGMFVIVSWISFLVPPEIVPGRMTLLVTVFLVLVNIFNTITTNIPKAEGLTGNAKFPRIGSCQRADSSVKSVRSYGPKVLSFRFYIKIHSSRSQG